MSYQYLTQKNKIKWPIFAILIGTFLGLILFNLINELSPKWAFLCVIVILFSCFPALINRVKNFLLVTLLFSLPLNLDISFFRCRHLGGADGLVLSLFDVSLAFLYFIWLCEIVRKKNARINFFPQISIPALCLFIMAFFSMINAPYKNLSLFEIIEMIKMYLGFFYLANHINHERDVKFLTICLLVGLFLEGLLGLAQFSSGKSFLPSGMGFRGDMIGYRSNYRVSGTWVSYNDFAWYLSFIIPISLSLLFSKIKLKNKLLCASIFVIGLGALFSTLSRAGYISIIMSMLFVLLLSFKKIKGKNNLYNFFVSLLLIMCIFFIIFVMNPKFLKVANRRMFFDDDNGSAQSRIPQMKVAYSIIKSNPFIGIGINNYTEVVHDYDTTTEGLLSLTPYQVHNIFLQIGAEMGVIALASFIWLIIAIYKIGLAYIKLDNNLMVNIVIGLLGGIAAFLLHGLVDATSIGGKLYLIFWVFAGIIAGINKIGTYKQSNI